MTELNYLLVSCTLFLLGIWGIFLNRKNIIIMLMSIELMLLAVNFNFLIFSVYLDDLMGQIFSLFILTVASFFVEFIHRFKGELWGKWPSG